SEVRVDVQAPDPRDEVQHVARLAAPVALPEHDALPELHGARRGFFLMGGATNQIPARLPRERTLAAEEAKPFEQRANIGQRGFDLRDLRVLDHQSSPKTPVMSGSMALDSAMSWSRFGSRMMGRP